MIAVLLLTLGVAGAPVSHEAEARRIEAALIAPCCWRQQVSVHSSPAADRIRADIRVRLASGQTAVEILRAYEAQYGVAILAEPPARGSNVLLYALPPLAFVAGAGLLGLAVRRFVRAGARAPAGAVEDTADRRLSEALDDELARME